MILIHLSGCIQSWKTWKSHGISFSFSRPGKVMEFDSKFWKFHKSHGNYKILPGSVLLLNQSHQQRDIDMSSMKIEIDSIFVITFCLNWLQIIHVMACLILPPCLGTCLFHAISQVKGHWIFSFGHWKVMEKLLPFSGYTLIYGVLNSDNSTVRQTSNI